MFKHSLRGIIVLLTAVIFVVSQLAPAFANRNCPQAKGGSKRSLYEGATGSYSTGSRTSGR